MVARWEKEERQAKNKMEGFGFGGRGGKPVITHYIVIPFRKRLG